MVAGRAMSIWVTACVSVRVQEAQLSQLLRRPRDASCHWIFREVTKGHSRSLELALDRSHTCSYRRSMVTMALTCIISKIKRDIGRISRFFISYPTTASVVVWGYYTIHERDRQKVGQTDRHRTTAYRPRLCRYRRAKPELCSDNICKSPVASNSG